VRQALYALAYYVGCGGEPRTPWSSCSPCSASISGSRAPAPATRALRHLVRGAPRRLVSQGTVIDHALAQEGISRAELEAGLRKLGFESPAAVELAVLEETGHISAVARKG
jgi:uncharacterized protein DUF421